MAVDVVVDLGLAQGWGRTRVWLHFFSCTFQSPQSFGPIFKEIVAEIVAGIVAEIVALWFRIL